MPLSSKVLVSTGGIHGNCAYFPPHFFFFLHSNSTTHTGWFAKEDIQCGETIWYAGAYDKDPTLRVHISTMKTWDPKKYDDFMALAYQVDDEWYSGYPEEGTKVPDDVIAENFVNHCCDGNCWYESDELLVASRDIKAGEEICYDYALTESHEEFALHCKCGKLSCRGLVTGNDWKLPELQQKYGNHFLPHINKKIQQQNK